MSIVVAIKRKGNFDHFENIEVCVLAQNTDPIGSGTLCGTYTKNDDGNQVATVTCSPPIIGRDLVFQQTNYERYFDIAEVYVYKPDSYWFKKTN